MYSSVDKTSKSRKFDFDNDIGNSANELTMPVHSEERARDYISGDNTDLFSLDNNQSSEQSAGADFGKEEPLDLNKSLSQVKSSDNSSESSSSNHSSETNNKSDFSGENESASPENEESEKRSLFSHGSVAKTPERKRTSHGIGKSGDKIHLSAEADKDARSYISDVDTYMPEKMRTFDGQKEENPNILQNDEKKSLRRKKRMKHIRRNQFSDSSSQPKGAGGFELDTGWVNFGVDGIDDVDSQSSGEKKKDKMKTPGEKRQEQNKNKKSNVYVSFQSNYDDDDSRQVKESREKKFHVGGANYVKSNDESLQTGAEYMESDSDKPKLLRTKWERMSEAKGNKGTYDDVAPFHETQAESRKINQLREAAKGAKDNRTEIQKAITGMQTYKNKKDDMKRNFDKKFDRKVTLIKEQYRSPSNFWLLLKKKKDEESRGNVWFDGVSDSISDDEKIIDGIVKNTVSDVFKASGKQKSK